MRRYNAHVTDPDSAMLAKTQATMTASKPERRAVNLSVSGALIDEARAQKINLSRVLEDALEAKLREQRASRWQAENREAIAAHNERIAREGMWHRGLTPWY